MKKSVTRELTFPQSPDEVCEVLTCDPPKALSFTWVAGEVDTRVEYRLEAMDGGTRVFFEQSGFVQDLAHRGAAYGWDMMHGKLTSLLSKGSE